jgi:hypothetical protein
MSKQRLVVYSLRVIFAFLVCVDLWLVHSLILFGPPTNAIGVQTAHGPGLRFEAVPVTHADVALLVLLIAAHVLVLLFERKARHRMLLPN